MYSPTPEKIQEVKAKFGDAFLIKVEDKAALFRSVDRKTLGYAQAAKENMLKFNETILNSCFIEGDKEILEVDKYFFGACQQAIGLVEVGISELEKL